MKHDEEIGSRDLIVASGIVLIWLAAFYVGYPIGRSLGSLLFA